MICIDPRETEVAAAPTCTCRSSRAGRRPARQYHQVIIAEALYDKFLRPAHPGPG